jgi:hypothetical protein
VFRLDEIAEAHRLMEDGHAGGKLVVVPEPGRATISSRATAFGGGGTDPSW